MKKITPLVIICCLSLFFSCKTLMSKTENTPEWSILSARIEKDRVFIDSRGVTEDRESALLSAGVSLESILINSIGITPEDAVSTPEQQAFLDKISRNISSVLNSDKPEKSFISLEKIQYREQKDSGIELYLLCSLTLEDYTDLKREADSLFDIKNPLYPDIKDAVDTLVQEGDLYGAIALYLDAAEVSISDLPLNGDLFFHRYITEVSSLLSQLKLRPLSLPEKERVDSSLTIPITLDVQHQGVPFVVLFDQKSPSGELKRSKAQLQTDKSGILPFFLPTPSDPGKYNITIFFNTEIFPEYSSLPAYCSEALAKLNEIAKKLTLIHSVDFYQDIKMIPTLIVAVESDISGKKLSTQWTAVEFEKALQGKKYNISLSNLDSGFITERNHEELIRDLRHLYRDDYQRVLLLDTRISEYKQNQELFTLTATCSVEVLNLVKGTVVSTLTDETSITLQDQRNMLSAAFSQLGQKMAEVYTR